MTRAIRTMTPEQEAEWAERAKRGDLGFSQMEPERHGDVREYWRHAHDGTPPCRPCLDAHAAYIRSKKAVQE